MSIRIEWTESKYASISVEKRGYEAEDGGKVTGDFCLFLGPVAIEGSKAELRTLLKRAVSQIEAA